jgi:MFS family permease
LLSGAIISGLSGTSGLEGWRWLFLIEGLITVFWGGCIKFIMLDYPKTENGRMSAAEIHLATVRLLHDRKMTVEQGAKILPPWEAVKAAVLEPRTWFFTALYFLANGCATISYFIPTILQQIGYKGVKAQWMTVPIWVVATLFLLVVPQISDRVQNRRWFVAGAFGLAFVSCIVIVATPGAHNAKIHYAFYVFYFSGIYTALPLILNWASEAAPYPKEKRAVMVAIISSVGNLSAIYGSRLWPKTSAPAYTMGFASMASFTGVACALAAFVPFTFKYLKTTGRTKAEKEVLTLQGTSSVERI